MPSAFAKKQLEKYGWAAGEGLGKDKEGRADYVKVTKRKTEGVGIGHEAAKGGTSNDDMGLNSVLKDMGSNKNKKSDVIITGGGDSSSDSSEDEEKKKKRKEIATQRQKRARDDKKNNNKDSSSSSSSDSDAEGEDITKWDDKTLFARCGGVRLGRGGRHRMFDGKLKRIEELQKKERKE
jgi:hypothetical protein